LTDRTRRIADGVSPAEYGRREAFRVDLGGRQIITKKEPREFVFMDRAAIGLGGVFLHLDAELNFYRLFNDQIAGFDLDELTRRQSAALGAASLGPIDAAA
jgi:hypothetical protein